MTTISVFIYSFDVSDPYHSGQMLSETDAQLLNEMRAGQIRQRIARMIPTDRILSYDEYCDVLGEFYRLDDEYKLQSRLGERHRRLSFFEQDIEFFQNKGMSEGEAYNMAKRQFEQLTEVGE